MAPVLTFELSRKGVWGTLGGFLSSLPKGCDIFWVTFTLLPTPESLQLLQQRNHRLSIICRHPKSRANSDESEGAFRENTVTRHAWQMLVPLRPTTIRSLKGLKAPPRYSDGEEDSVGKLHAKYVVARSPKGVFYLAIGSFNFAAGSLDRNCESLLIAEDSELADCAWREAEWLHGHEQASELSEADCEDDSDQLPPAVPRDWKDVGAIDAGPAETGSDEEIAPTRPTPEQERAEERYRPEALLRLAATLDEWLADWPRESGDDWQWREFLRLRKRNRPIDLLYLPVGVGKTFIALRWLLWKVHQVAARGHVGIFLTPNEWIERSVNGDLARLREASGVDPSPYLVVRRPSALAELKGRAAAVVADECHNWNPDPAHTEAPTYTRVLEELRRKKTPILGLSATPCRMDHGRFSVRTFSEAFLGAAQAITKPRVTLPEAVQKGLLTRPTYTTLLADRQERIKEILSTDTDELIAMGDYSSATLRDVWLELAGRRPTDLVDAIQREIRRSSVRRVVVFLPPVGTLSDRFVGALSREIRGIGGSAFDFRSASASGADAVLAFTQFRDAESDPGRPAVLFTVDRFAEGVSITDIDMLVMLRATLSPRVAVQALGRGLRLHQGKTQCTILDGVLFEERLQLWERGVDDLRPSGRREPTPSASQRAPRQIRTIGGLRRAINGLRSRGLSVSEACEEVQDDLDTPLEPTTLQTYYYSSAKDDDEPLGGGSRDAEPTRAAGQSRCQGAMLIDDIDRVPDGDGRRQYNVRVFTEGNSASPVHEREVMKPRSALLRQYDSGRKGRAYRFIVERL